MTRFKRDFDFNENIIEVVAYNVIKYRKLNKITQEQLALDIGVSPEFIRKFESTKGSEGLSLLSLYKISVVLNVSIDKFFESIEVIDQ
ncbi:MAG: helix-turn-helix transcriptional regulator [Bacilli bacterium]|nr:helix-turn-helix transcriptional regulator [Bacilli bacterium]